MNNQYPPSFFEPLIHATLTKLVEQYHKDNKEAEKENDRDPYMSFFNYRGKCSEQFAKDLYRICNDPNEPRNEKAKVIFTLKKLKTVLPQLKPQIPRMLRSGNVYQIDCPSCTACYVGQTAGHLQTRFGEHINKKGPVKTHITTQCKVELKEEHIKILGRENKSNHLLTLEALFIRDVKPTLNTKEEYRRKTLVIKK